MKTLTKHEEAMIFADKYTDLPDGAFWALAEENGLYPEDFIEEDEE